MAGPERAAARNIEIFAGHDESDARFLFEEELVKNDLPQARQEQRTSIKVNAKLETVHF